MGMLKWLKNKLFKWITYEPPTSEVMPYDFNRLKHELRPGDVLLIEGRSRVASIIRTITQTPWTHAALYVGRLIDYEDEELQDLIHSHGEDLNIKTRIIIEDLLDKGTVVT